MKRFFLFFFASLCAVIPVCSHSLVIDWDHIVLNE